MRTITIILLVSAAASLVAAITGALSGSAVFWLGIALLTAQTVLYFATRPRRK